MLQHTWFAGHPAPQTDCPLVPDRRKSQSYNTCGKSWKRESSCPLSPLFSLSLPASRFLAFSSQESHPSLPTHLTPQNLPFQGESAFFTQLQGQVLVPRFCISILSSLGWDSLRAHRRNGCTGTYSSGSGDPGRRSWIPLLLGTSPHTS